MNPEHNDEKDEILTINTNRDSQIANITLESKQNVNHGEIKDLHCDKHNHDEGHEEQETHDHKHLKKTHSATIISLKEKQIIDKIIKSNQEGQKNAIKKLVLVSIICIFFMSAELVGGIMANSLAILSDAAHMLSDFSGFAISMISIIISRNKPTFKLSYGYHRAEVIGAICSVLLIWGLTAWLVHEAIDKVMKDSKVDSPIIMLIVAIIGLICNIVMGHVLHSAGGHHHHGHSHGHAHDAHDAHDAHEHNHEEHEEDNKKDKVNKKHNHDKRKKVAAIDDKKNNPAINNISTASEEALNEPLLSDNTIKMDHSCASHDHKHEEEGEGHSHTNCDHEHKHEEEGHNHKHEEKGHTHDNKCDHDHKHDHKHEEEGHKHDKNCDHDHKHDHKHEEEGHTHEHEHEEEVEDDHHDHDNLNIRAAFIHVIGDLIQSVGVVIAAVIILIYPHLYIIDPICTFLFSILVLFTTIPILCDCIRVFMEGTPTGVDTIKLLADLYTVLITITIIIII